MSPELLIYHSPHPFLQVFKQPKILNYLSKIQAYLATGCAERDAEQAATQVADQGVSVLTLADSEYPELLRQIHDPPIVLARVGSGLEITPVDDQFERLFVGAEVLLVRPDGHIAARLRAGTSPATITEIVDRLTPLT